MTNSLSLLSFNAELRPLPSDTTLSENENHADVSLFLNTPNMFSPEYVSVNTLTWRVLSLIKNMAAIEAAYQAADRGEWEDPHLTLEMLPILVEFKGRHKLQAILNWVTPNTSPTDIRAIGSALVPIAEELSALTVIGRTTHVAPLRFEELLGMRTWTSEDNHGKALQLVESYANSFKDTNEFVAFMANYAFPEICVVDGFNIRQHRNLRERARQLASRPATALKGDAYHFVLDLVRFYTGNY